MFSLKVLQKTSGMKIVVSNDAYVQRPCIKGTKYLSRTSSVCACSSTCTQSDNIKGNKGDTNSHINGRMRMGHINFLLLSNWLFLMFMMADLLLE